MNGTTLREPARASLEVLVLASAGDVAALRARPFLRPFPAPRSVTICLPGLSSRERARAARRIETWLNACGCSFGALAVLGSLVGLAVMAARASHWTPTLVLGVLGSVLAIGALARVGAQVIARVLLRVELRRLQRIANAQT